MRTYWFTIATPGKYMRFAEDLVRSAELWDIEIDVLGQDVKGGKKAKSFKIQGILNAPSWADRVVFIDADTLIADPRGIEDHTGVILEPWKHPEGMYAVEGSRTTKKRRINKLYKAARELGVPEGTRGGEFAQAEWNTGVLTGSTAYLQELVTEWQKWWVVILECNDGKFRRDQMSFKFAYIAIHKKKYGYSDLPREYNWLIKRWGFSPKGKILHKAGKPDYRKCRQWTRVKKDIFSGFYYGEPRKVPKDIKLPYSPEPEAKPKPKRRRKPSGSRPVKIPKFISQGGADMDHPNWYNPFKTCTCGDSCSHQTEESEIVRAYYSLLRFFAPSSVFEWGSGPCTGPSLEMGCSICSISHRSQPILFTGKERLSHIQLPISSEGYVSLHGMTDCDFYLINGARKPTCVQTVFREAREDAVVCMMNAQKKQNQGVLSRYTYVRFLEQGFCIACRDRKILELEYSPEEEKTRWDILSTG